MRRLQLLAAALVVTLAVGGAMYAGRELAGRTRADEVVARAPSGEWFCPHGGGKAGWEVQLEVANPGEAPATIRVRAMGKGRPRAARTLTVDPGSLVRVPVAADGRERASMVEWFDQWVAVGWLAHAGGDEGGVAAEPCAAAAGGRWLLPDGTTETDEDDDYVVVMNPFARDAVFSVTLLSDRKAPVQQGDLTDMVLPSYHSVAVRLGDVVAGERTVSALVEASVGRVAAATLGVSRAGGIRSAIGYLGEPSATLAFPGGADAGRTELVVMNTGVDRVDLGGDLLEKEVEQLFAGLADSSPPAESGRTFPATTSGPTSVVFAPAPGVAATRRTFGVASDQAASEGSAPAAAWVVLPAVFGAPSHPGLVLTNIGEEPAELMLSRIGPGPGGSVTLSVPPRRTVPAPKAFLEEAPGGAVLAVATSGTFVPAAASYSRGRDGFATYAVALGIPIPDGWVPS